MDALALVSDTLQVASDLHLEFLPDTFNDWGRLLVPRAPVLALAGDICTPAYAAQLAKLQRFLAWCAGRFALVLYVAGNHEYYSPGRHPKTVPEIQALLHDLCGQWPNVRFMHKQALIINNDTVRILGTTLWSAMPPTPELRIAVANSMNDYRRIHVPEPAALVSKRRLLSTWDVNTWHTEERWWLEEQIAAAAACNQTVVVITHHTPSLVGTSAPPTMYAGGLGGTEAGGSGGDAAAAATAWAYSSPLDHLLCAPVKAWVFGHTHYTTRRLLPSGTLLVSNQRGYDSSLSTPLLKDCVVTL